MTAEEEVYYDFPDNVDDIKFKPPKYCGRCAENEGLRLIMVEHDDSYVCRNCGAVEQK